MQVTVHTWNGTTRMQRISDTDEGAAHIGRMISNELRGVMAISEFKNVEISICARLPGEETTVSDTASGGTGCMQSASGNQEAETRVRRLVNLLEDAVSAGVQIGRDSMRK